MVEREYPDLQDWRVAMLRFLASRLDGATHGRDVVALSREFVAIIKLLGEDHRPASRPVSRLDEIRAQYLERHGG
jgi:hypothetical protein